MYADEHVVFLDAVAVRDVFIEDLRHALHFQIVIARTQRPHLVLLALAGMLRNLGGISAGHSTPLLHALQVGLVAIALRHRPLRAPGEHLVHLAGVQVDMARAPEAGGDGMIQGRRQGFPPSLEIMGLESRIQGSHPTGDVETHSARRDDTALRLIEGRHAADGKTVAPVGVGHGIGGLDDARQGGHVHGLFRHLIVQAAYKIFVAIEDGRDAHPAPGR